MPIHELAALGAAVCWAMTGLLAAAPVRALGPFGFNLIRQGFVAGLLAVLVAATGRWRGIDPDWVGPLVWSGLVGIFLGDTVLFFALQRLGPRRTGALFAMNAPLAALLGWLFLGETLSAQGVAGVALCSAGVAVCVLGRGGLHHLDRVRGPVWIGVALGLLAALGQAGGSLIARPAMAAGMDPVVGSLIRVAVAVACLSALGATGLRLFRPTGPLTAPVAAQIMASGLLAMVVGMTLLLFALQGGKVGIVSTLSALSPVMILPILWAVTGERPTAASWTGALLAVAGMALIFLR
ncbi:DMT family transporter [Paracoccus endophyticus]|uniref:DMT family transporter n=1 Tax=Paracoccus endophyticus TaxID=2233774 RepID=UPI000DD8A121|nr:DMT family transporter [Paracoccus endophyticus]